MEEHKVKRSGLGFEVNLFVALGLTGVLYAFAGQEQGRKTAQSNVTEQQHSDWNSNQGRLIRPMGALRKPVSVSA